MVEVSKSKSMDKYLESENKAKAKDYCLMIFQTGIPFLGHKVKFAEVTACTRCLKNIYFFS